MTTQTLSDISTLKPGTRIGSETGLKVTVVNYDYPYLFVKNLGITHFWLRQGQIDHKVKHSDWKILYEIPEYDWKNELRERQDEFIIHKRDSECICDTPELDLIPLYAFIEEVIARNK